MFLATKSRGLWRLPLAAARSRIVSTSLSPWCTAMRATASVSSLASRFLTSSASWRIVRSGYRPMTLSKPLVDGPSLSASPPRSTPKAQRPGPVANHSMFPSFLPSYSCLWRVAMHSARQKSPASLLLLGSDDHSLSKEGVFAATYASLLPSDPPFLFEVPASHRKGHSSQFSRHMSVPSRLRPLPALLEVPSDHWASQVLSFPML
jgi:hypothetical protein